MTPDEKKSAMQVMERHDSAYTVACLKELHNTCHVPFAEMQNLRVCLELARKDPTHLERGVPHMETHMETTPLVQQPQAVKDAEAALPDVTKGLMSFQLHPKKPDGSPLFTGMEHFEHLQKIARRSVNKRTLPLRRARILT